jgi:uncharacterized protein YndB with AHSA1/START domain
VPTEQALAQFLDRHTLVYERRYPHDIELVFEAVSTGEHLDEWMLPESQVERFEGGKCAFGWGGPADAEGATHGTVSVFDPPKAVQYTFATASNVKGSNSYMRFDLEPEGDGTLLRFTLHFLPAPDEHADDWSGGDLPAPGTAWKPGFVAGYHDFLDDLFTWLRGELDAKAKMDAIMSGDHHEGDLIVRYREHIRANCPPE